MTDLTPHATPLPLLRLSRTEALARTTIAQRAIGLPLRLGCTEWRARLVPAIAPEPLHAAQAAVWLHFEWAGAVLALCLPPAAVEQLLAAELDHALLPELPPDLLGSVLEAGLADALQALQALGRGTPHRMPSSGPEPGAALPLHAFDLQLHAAGGPEAITARLHADGLGLLLLAGLLSQRAPQPGPASAAVPVLLRAELGCTRVALDELQALALGDVVLVETSFMGSQRTLWLSADGHAGLHVQWPATPTPTQSPSAADAVDGANAAPPDFLTILHPWSASMPASTPHDSADGAAAAATLQALPVRLSFDLGEVSLTLAQLQALQPGQTLPLGHPLAGAVRIRANGVLVGEGDLVEIDSQLGVSVRTLFGSSAA